MSIDLAIALALLAGAFGVLIGRSIRASSDKASATQVAIETALKISEEPSRAEQTPPVAIHQTSVMQSDGQKRSSTFYTIASDSPTQRAVQMLTAYAEMIKATGKYAEMHYIPDIEFVIEELIAGQAGEQARAAQAPAEPSDEWFHEDSLTLVGWKYHSKNDGAGTYRLITPGDTYNQEAVTPGSMEPVYSRHTTAHHTLYMSREQVSALYLHLFHRETPEFGWMEAPLKAIEKELELPHTKIHAEDFGSMDRQFLAGGSGAS